MHHRQILAESQTPSFSFFSVFCCLWVEVGSIMNSQQKGNSSSLFFLFFFPFILLLVGAGGLHLPTFDKEGAWAPSFFFVFCFCCLWVQVGAIAKILVEKEIAPPFFHLFVSSWVPSLSLSTIWFPHFFGCF
jgi:hypothetical protein